MTATIENAANHSVNPSTLRVRRHRERRRKGVSSFSVTVELSRDDIADAIARGRLNPDYDAWDVFDAWYVYHLSDAALEWLVNAEVVCACPATSENQYMLASTILYRSRCLCDPNPIRNGAIRS